jgi:hypothetical protein
VTPLHLSTSGRGSTRLRAAAATAALTALPLLSLAAVPGAAHAAALRTPALYAPRHDRQPQTVNVAMSNSGFTLPAQVNAGFVTFATTTADPTGHALQGFRLNAGVTQAKALQDLKQATSTTPSVSAAGITATTKDITAVGGATVDPLTPVQVTIPLTAGTYYFLDFNQLFAPGHQVTLQTMQVTGAFDGDTPAHGQEIVQTTANGRPRFTAPSSLNTTGTFLISNQADEIHEAVFQRVNSGVTDTAVQTFFNAAAQNQKPTSNPFAEQGMRGAGAISPGRTELLHFSPPAGSYSLECFVPDDKTGVPHAFLGMHQVVALSTVSGPVSAGQGGSVRAGDTRELAIGAGLTAAALVGGLALLRRRAAAKA